MNSEQQIVSYLKEVADVLCQLQVSQPFHIVLAGGVFMILKKQRSFTEDIDFANVLVPDPLPSRGFFQATVIHDEVSRPRSGIPYAREFRQAIAIVAQRHPGELAEDWMNDQAAEYLYDDAPHPEIQLWQVFGNLLYVYLPTVEYILATKIAARRDKDTNDIERLIELLNITRREQLEAIVHRFLLPEAQEFWQVAQTLDELFA